jgi:5-methylthioribose kinase
VTGGAGVTEAAGVTANGASEYALLIDRDDVVAHLHERGLLHLVAGAAGGDESGTAVEVVEVTAGNMNRVFIARGPAGSLAVKQAPPWVQVAGPEWPIDPSRIVSEARTYERLAERVPESIPRIIDFDEHRYVLVMEDLSSLEVLRDALVRRIATPDDALDIDFEALGAVVGRFVGSLTAATSRLALGDEEHVRLVELAANPELCALTVDVVLDEPYREHEHNHWHPALSSRVSELYADDGVREAVAAVRHDFETRHEALVHGDLHSGSVMIGRGAGAGAGPGHGHGPGDADADAVGGPGDPGVAEVTGAAHPDGAQRVVVFDPEFSFVGPVGLDLGLFWANLELAAIAASAVGDEKLARARYSAVPASWAAFAEVWSAAGHPASSLEAIERDAWRFAGVEGIRRCVGYSHAADIESLPSALLPDASARLFDAARHHLLTGEALPSHPFEVGA